MAQTLNGRNMNATETKVFIDGFITNQKFVDLVSTLRTFIDFQETGYSIKNATMFDAYDYNDNPVSVKRASLIYDDVVKIDVYHVTDKDKNVSEIVFGAITTMNFKEEKITNDFLSTTEGVQYLASYVTDDSELKENTIELNQNPHYVPFQNYEAKIQGWFDDATKGCYPGYRHCGKGCGDGMKYGGGTPIDNLDILCRAHDRCWKTFGSWDPCCDKNLLVGSRSVTGDEVLKDIISIVFSNSASKCK